MFDHVIGIVAKSYAEVNTFFVPAIAAGGREKTVPAPQLQYNPDYYATWVVDPGGLVTKQIYQVEDVAAFPG
jgi:hypothetical protein